MHYIIVFVIVAISFVFHHSAYLAYHTPKNFLLIITGSAALMIYWIYRLLKDELILVVSIIEIFLLVRLIWLVITNPAILTNPSNLVFWILLSLMLITFLARQIANINVNLPDNSLVVANFYKDRVITYFFRALWMIGLIQAFIGFYQWFQYKDLISPLLKTPMIGTIGAANGYGSFLAVAIIAAFVDIENKKNRTNKVLIFSGIGLMFGALLLNRSRGALLGLMSASVIVLILFLVNENKFFKENHLVGRYLLQLFKGLKKNKLILITVMSLIFFCLLVFGFFMYNRNPESSAGRLMVWKISAPMISDHPVSGVGHGRFGVEYLYYQARFFQNPQNKNLTYKAANMKQAHNEYLQAFCESGILGGILFLSIWIFALWCVYQHLRKKTDSKIMYYGIAAILLTILIHAFIDTPLHVLPISVITYISLGLVPMNSFSYRIKIKAKVIQWGLLFLFIIYTAFLLLKICIQYPGYIDWKKGYQFKEKLDWKSAVSHYQAAFKRLPGNSNLLFHLGGAMSIAGDCHKGRDLLKESLKNHTDKNVYLCLASTSIKLKDFNEAEQYALTALSMFPDHLLPHLFLGEIYYHQGKIKKSKASLRKCINRQTRIRSADVMNVSKAAEELWEEFYRNQK